MTLGNVYSDQYALRRRYIIEEHKPLITSIEEIILSPSDEDTAALLRSFNEDGVHAIWQKNNPIQSKV